MKNLTLYENIKAYSFDAGYDVHPGKRFEEKLAIANGWTMQETLDIIDEYKKFMYLAIEYGKVAPSDKIDQVWHQHILYTVDYTNFCAEYAGRMINHSPDRTHGASVDSYDHTTDIYIEEFGEQPDPKIWGLTNTTYMRVDITNNYLVPADNVLSAIRLVFIFLSHKIKLLCAHS